MRCPSCNFLNREGVRFCENCGNTLPQPVVPVVAPAPTSMGQSCSQCDAINRMGVRFCENCGASLSVISTAPTQNTNSKKLTGRKPNLLLRSMGGALILFLAALSFLLLLRWSNGKRYANGMLYITSQNGNAPTLPEHLNGNGEFTEGDLTYYEVKDTGAATLIYKENGFLYYYVDGRWIAVEIIESNGFVESLRQLIKQPEKIYVYGTEAGRVTKQNGGYVFLPNDSSNDWVVDQIEGFSQVHANGAAWDVNPSSSIDDWATSQPVDGGLWGKDDSEWVLIQTADLGDPSYDKLKFKYFSNPLRNISRGQWISIALVNPIAGSVIEAALRLGTSEGCGDKDWQWVVPDGDFLSHTASLGFIEVFGKACKRHDECYLECDQTKKACDHEFFDNMKSACKSAYLGSWENANPLYDLCWANADIYKEAVELKGDSFYDVPHIDDFSMYFYASTLSLTAGSCTQLNWDVKGSDVKFASIMEDTGYVRQNIDIANVAIGSQSVCPAQTTVYTLSVPNCLGIYSSKSIKINVAQPAGETTAVDFWSDDYSIELGDCTALHWSVTGASKITLDQGGADPIGKARVCPSQTTSYTITATDPTGG